MTSKKATPGLSEGISCRWAQILQSDVSFPSFTPSAIKRAPAMICFSLGTIEIKVPMYAIPMLPLLYPEYETQQFIIALTANTKSSFYLWCELLACPNLCLRKRIRHHQLKSCSQYHPNSLIQYEMFELFWCGMCRQPKMGF